VATRRGCVAWVPRTHDRESRRIAHHSRRRREGCGQFRDRDRAANASKSVERSRTRRSRGFARADRASTVRTMVASGGRSSTSPTPSDDSPSGARANREHWCAGRRLITYTDGCGTWGCLNYHTASDLRADLASSGPRDLEAKEPAIAIYKFRRGARQEFSLRARPRILAVVPRCHDGYESDGVS